MEEVERVRNLEIETLVAKKAAAKALRAERLRLDLTLKQVAAKVRGITTVTVYNTEKCKTWRTRTAAKIARFYESAAA